MKRKILFLIVSLFLCSCNAKEDDLILKKIEPMKENRIEDMGKLFGKSKTNEDGIATFTKLEQGRIFYVQEVKALKDYILDN